jgi:hypothetical protein
MLPLYAARIGDLGARRLREDRLRRCHHVALLTPEALLRVGLSPGAQGGCGAKRRAVVPSKWRERGLDDFARLGRIGVDQQAWCGGHG